MILLAIIGTLDWTNLASVPALAYIIAAAYTIAAWLDRL